MIDDDDVTLEHGPVTRHVTLIPVLGTDGGGGGNLYLLLFEAGPMGLVSTRHFVAAMAI